MDIFKGTGNILLMGKAGTGKSYNLNKYIEEHPNTLVTAPTGIAAVNIGGITMHRAFGIPLPAYGYKPSDIKNDIVKQVAKADSIIIDEISMCRNDNFSFSIKVIKKAEKLKGKKIRLIFSGDFSQLPPVVTKTEYKELIKYGFDPSGFIFTTKEWKSLKLKPVILDKIMRQSDIEFIEALSKVRQGDESILPYFNQFVNTDITTYSDYIRICGTNAEADRINNDYLNSLQGNVFAYPCRKEGRVPNGIFDEVFIIKEGAEVIFTANDVKHNLYNNGTMGIVKKCLPSYMVIEINGKDYDIYPKEQPIYDIDSKATGIVKKQIGTIWYMPLKLGRAITIHKSQGQTFEKAAITPDIFAPGQLYVALSRVKSPNGLILTKEIPSDALKKDPLVEAFYENNYGYIETELPKEKKTKKTTSKSSSSKKKNTTTKKETSKTKKTVTKKATGKKITKTKSDTKTKKSLPKTKKTDTKVKKITKKTDTKVKKPTKSTVSSAKKTTKNSNSSIKTKKKVEKVQKKTGKSVKKGTI